MYRVMIFALAMALAWSGNVLAREVPIADFFKDAEFTTITLSPDGKHMAVTAPQADRTVLAVMRVTDKKVVGKWDYGENRHIRGVAWANDERLIFVVSLKLGRFDFEVGKGDMYASNIDGTKRIDIPNGGYYSIMDMTREDPKTILVQRSIESAFLFKLNVYTGAVTTVASAPVEQGGFIVDHERNVRFAYGVMNDGSSVTYRREGEKWLLVHKSERNGASYSPIGFAADNRHVYMYRSEEGEPGAIILVDTETWKEKLLSSNATVSPSSLLWSVDEKTLLAVGYDDGLPTWEFVEPDHAESKVYAGLIKAFPGKGMRFLSPTRDGRYFGMRVYADTHPSEAYLFDRETGKASYLAGSMDWINADEMSPMRPVSVKTRDGLVIHGYLTIPRDSDGKNLPLIVNPHGGPHGLRDDWGFNPEVQLFANRGYAVLQMNYRGSGGYGSTFEGSGYRKWGTTMQDDLTDSVGWAVAQGIADPDRMCIYGASYGGYAALMSVVREPDLYRCTVGYVGVYDLDLQWGADFADSEGGRNYLRDVYPEEKSERLAQSPAYGVSRIKVPVMLVHGRKDVRVPIRHMTVLIDRMAKVGKKPEIVIVQNKEAHGFQDLDNQVDLYTQMLGFFDKYIGDKRKAAP